MVLHVKRQVVSDRHEKDMTNDIKDTFYFRLPLVNDEGNMEESYMHDDHDMTMIKRYRLKILLEKKFRKNSSNYICWQLLKLYT